MRLPLHRRRNSAKFINSQRQDQWLSSKFIGIDVIGPDDEKIGDVTDILFEKNGKVVAYVVGVGGFLGIGAKNVALAPTRSRSSRRQVEERADELRLVH